MRGDRGTGGPPPPAADPIGDPRRLAVIADLGLGGQDGDIHLDAILRTLAAACGVSIAAVNIITPGRQTYAAEIGLDAPCADLPDEFSFCATLVATGVSLVVPDATLHPVLRSSPVVRDGMVGAYAGEPLVHRGVIVGALGIFDARPRVFTDAELTVLHEQARLAEMILTMRNDADRTTAVMLRSLIDHSESLTYVKDLQGRYLLANPTMEQVFSLTETELLGRTAPDLDPERGPVWQANDQRAVEGTLHVEEFLDRPDGEHVFESVKYPLTDASGRVYATAGVSLDVTARRRVAQAMADARDAAMAASRQKSSFLATMSHEIRTPMNAVIGMTGLLLDTPLDTQQREFVETVRSSGEALLSIINDILDFSKIEAGGLRLEHRPFELLAAVRDAVELVGATARAADLDLVVDVDRRCPTRVVGDPTRLGQVLVNLVGNAVKFTPRGEVRVRVEPSLPGTAATGEAATGEAATGGAATGGAATGPVRLTFSVADTGIGILADRQASLFESFSQVDASTTRLYGGTGLGLAISRRLVEAMGGRLSVDSAIGVGSTFSFTVALDEATRSEQSWEMRVTEAAGRPAVPPGSLRVLLAEDNAVNRRLGLLMLQKLGHRVDVVGNGRDAAEAVRRSGYDAVLMDVEMPVLDGLEATRRIRSEVPPHRQPQIVALTAGALIEDRRACLAAGMDDHLGKPVRLSDLDAALTRVAVRIGIRPVAAAAGG